MSRISPTVCGGYRFMFLGFSVPVAEWLFIVTSTLSQLSVSNHDVSH